MVSPATGFWMAFRWMVVMRGGKNPLAVDLTSSIAEASGRLLSALIPTWPKLLPAISSSRIIKTEGFFIIGGLV